MYISTWNSSDLLTFLAFGGIFRLYRAVVRNRLSFLTGSDVLVEIGQVTLVSVAENP